MHLVERELALLVKAAEQRVAHGGRLVMDFLLHEGAEAIFLGSGGIPLDFERLALGRVAVVVGDGDLVGRDGHDLVVGHLDGGLGVVDEAGDVRAQEVLALAQADNQRRVAAGSDDAVCLLGMNGQEGERTLEALAGELHSAGEVTVGLVVEDVSQQRRSDLGVGLRHEVVALRRELGLELGEVLDDAVVDDGQLAAIDNVRVRVEIRWTTVGCPAGVADTQDGVLERACRDLLLESSDLTGLLAPPDFSIREDCDTSRVIAAVFESTQSLENNVKGKVFAVIRVVTDVSNNSTHSCRCYLIIPPYIEE